MAALADAADAEGRHGVKVRVSHPTVATDAGDASAESGTGGRTTRTNADVWSIEAAVESGRRTAQIIEPHVLDLLLAMMLTGLVISLLMTMA